MTRRAHRFSVGAPCFAAYLKYRGQLPAAGTPKPLTSTSPSTGMSR